MSLTDTAIRNAKLKDKQYKIADDKGLYLLVKKSGKYFRWDYRFDGKRKTLALGVYPDVKLKEARERHNEARQLLQNDVDPAQHKREKRHQRIEQAVNSLEAIAREWFTKNKHIWTEGHSRTIMGRLENNVFPWLGSRPVMAISAPELLAMLRRIEDRGALETAHRIKQICGQVFRYAIATGRAERDPSADLRGALPPTKPKHMATMTDPKEIGGLLRSIDDYRGSIVTRCALQLAPLVFVRPGELRQSEWAEINFDTGEWRIPAEKMKASVMHIIPLSRQALDVLQEIHPLTGHGRYVFPSPRTDSRPMSSNAILSALRRMGYAKDEMSGHGFRSMASTLLNEQGWNRDAIERQLAHAERNSVRAAYNYAEFMPERQKMMQAWADYLEGIKSGVKIIPIRAAV